MALSPKGACDVLGDCAQGFWGVRYSATEVADPLAILRMALSPFQGACNVFRKFIQRFERRTPLAKVNLGPLPQGGVRYSAPPVYLGGVRYSATEVADPLAILRMALSPFQGACVIPLRQFI